MPSLAAPRFIPEPWVRHAMRPTRQKTVRLRHAGTAESGLVRELARAFREENGNRLSAEEAAAIDQLLSQPELGAVYLISLDDETVGYLVLCYGFSLEYRGRDAFIDEFYLLPVARNRGTGARVLALLDEEAVRADVRALHLEVLSDNPRVTGLYRRNGYRDRRSLLMTKRISSLRAT